MKDIRCTLLVAWLGLAAAADAQREPQNPTHATTHELSVTVDTGGVEWLPRNGTLSLTFDRVLTPEDGRLAVVLGSTDITELFDRQGASWRYRSELLPLPSGEHSLIVYRAAPDGQWTEVASHEIRVLRKGGIERGSLSPRLDLSLEARIDDRRTPEDPSLESQPDEKGTLRIGLDGEMTRRGWTLGERFEVLGVSERTDALRFYEVGEEADNLDLASYWLGVRRSLRHGDLALEIGHVGWEGHPYLGTMQHRGLTLEVPVAQGIAVSAVAVSGSALVGWDDPLGLERSSHRVYGLGATIELLPNRPGGLRLALDALDGSVLPIADFGRGEVTDAETSRGLGVELRGESPAGRIRFDGAWATSRFANPLDPLLAQGSDLVAVDEETRQAWNGGIEIDLLRAKPLGETRTIDLTLAVRHEEIEPQFRSVAAFVAADRRHDSAELRGQIGVASVQLSHSRSRDNLDRIASILTTRTRRSAANLSVPLGELFGGSAAWPVLTYGADRTHQFGVALPENGGFSASHIPDQVSLSHTLSLDWTGARWRLGYRLAFSDQDNRQPGRELADFEGLVHGLSVGWSPHQRLDLGLDLDREIAESIAAASEETITRLGLSFALRLPHGLGFTGQWSESDSEDTPRLSMSTSELVDLGFTWDFARAFGPAHLRRGKHGIGGQLYVRYAEQEFDALDILFGFADARSSRSITAGLNLNLH